MKKIEILKKKRNNLKRKIRDLEADVKQLGLFHHNQDRFDPEMDMIVVDCDRRIAKKNETLKCFAVSSDMAFML